MAGHAARLRFHFILPRALAAVASPLLARLFPDLAPRLFFHEMTDRRRVAAVSLENQENRRGKADGLLSVYVERV